MCSKTIDSIEPKDKWEFDEKVADCFENMLERSIPQYELMRDSVANLAYDMINFDVVKDTFTVLDIGCSDGLMIEKLLSVFKDKGNFVGIDVSEPMLKKAKWRLLDRILEKRVKIENCDLRTGFPDGYFDVVTSILAIQFTPIEYRQSIIQRIYDSLSIKNGTFIMVEKVLGNTDKLNNVFVKNYYKQKKTEWLF